MKIGDRPRFFNNQTVYFDSQKPWSVFSFTQSPLLPLDGILNAARAGGFTQGDILRTLLARNQTTRRVAAMAQAAVDAAGDAAISDLFDRLRAA